MTGERDTTTVFIVGASGWLGADLLRDIRGAVPVPTSRILLEGGACLRSLGVGPNSTLVNAAGTKDPEAMHRVNVGVTATIVDFVQDSGSRVVHLGSAAEYGLSGGRSQVHESDQAEPQSHYGETKLEATELVQQVGELGVVLRLFNIAAAPPQTGSPLADIVSRVRRGVETGEDVEVLSAGATRDWISKRFVLHSIEYAALGSLGGVFNIASGMGVSMGDLARALVARLESSVDVRDLEEFSPTSIVGDPRRWERASGMRELLGAEGIAGVVCPRAGPL